MQGDCRSREEALILGVELCDNGFMHHGTAELSSLISPQGERSPPAVPDWGILSFTDELNVSEKARRGRLAFGIVLQNTDTLVLFPFLLKNHSGIEILSSSVNKLVFACTKSSSRLHARVHMTNISSVMQAQFSAVRTC